MLTPLHQAHKTFADIQTMEPVILLGMHRSGTSLTTRLLSDVGCNMGRWLSRDAEAVFYQRINRQVFSPVNAKWGNVDAFIDAMHSEAFIDEQVKVVEATLRRKISDLNRNVGKYPSWGYDFRKKRGQPYLDCWGWKDPRTTLTFPIWLRLFPRARVVHVIRNGIDVAISTHRRSLKQKRKLRNAIFPLDYSPETLDFDYCFHLWERYVNFVLERRHLIPDDRYYEIRYEDLLQNPESSLQSLLTFLGQSVSEERMHQACQRIDTSRIDNSSYSATYTEAIKRLAGRPLMANLNYTYTL